MTEELFREDAMLESCDALVIGLGPLVGAAALAWLFVEATRSMSDPDASYSGETILGVLEPRDAAELDVGHGCSS